MLLLIRNMALVFALISTTTKAEDVLRVYNWADYIDPQVLTDFEKKSGIKVDYKEFSTSSELLESLERGELYDVIVPTSDSVLSKLLKEHKLQAIKIEELKNYKSINPILQIRLSGLQQAHKYVVPYAWGAIGLFVNTKIAEPLYGAPLPNSWEVLFDPVKSSLLSTCGVTLIPSKEEVFSIWMQYKGQSLGNSGPRRILKSAALIRPAGTIIAPTEFSAYIDMIGNDKACVGMAWGGMVKAANKDGKLRFSIPKEGSLLFVDSLAIPVNAPNPTIALRFIDFMLAPENLERNALATDFTPPDKESQSRLSFLESLTEKQRAAVAAGWESQVVPH